MNRPAPRRVTRLICASLLACAALLLATGADAEELAADAAESNVLGEFRPQPAMTLYLPVESAALNLTALRDNRPEGDRLMVRLFDPEENLAYWQYFEPGMVANDIGLGDGEIHGIPLDMNPKPQTNALLADLDLALPAPGVWQLRVSAGAMNSAIRLTSSTPLHYGVSFQNGTFSPWDTSVEEAYLFVPPHARKLELRGGPVRIFDETGKELTPAEGSDADTHNYTKERLTIPVTKTGVVWRVSFPSPKKWSFRAAGFPVILCDSPETAQIIHGSVEELEDGTVVSHKFQKRLHELMPQILAKTGDSDALTEQLLTNPDAWLADARRNALLLNKYSLWPTLAVALRDQNLDPSSHWRGGVTAWKKLGDNPAPDNRWDNFLTIPGTFAGISDGKCYDEALAEAWRINAPFNPYFGKEEVLYRAVAVAFADLLALGEDEVFRGVDADMDPYPGFMAFMVPRKNFPSYAILAPHLPPELRNVWTEALRRILDRHLPDGLVTCRNQSSHYLVASHMFAEGSRDPRYRRLARHFVSRYVQGQAPAGYGVESMGPDASYTGMQHWHMGFSYRLDPNPVLLGAIRKSYTFYNHTVAPEPDGTVLGGYNYAHRVADSFVNEQWSGARTLVDTDAPEVALWRKYAKVKDGAAEEEIRSVFEKGLPEPGAPMLVLPGYHYWNDAESLTDEDLPAVDKKSFTRDIGGELVAAKRPAYYAAVYVGKPAPIAHYVRLRDNIRTPRPDADENNGGIASGKSKYQTPFTGGGLTLFWSPAYGTAFAGTNWSPLCRHGLLATTKDNLRYWEDYFATAYELDAKAGRLTVTGRIEQTPLSYERVYEFLPDRVRVSLTLTATDAVTLGNFVENIPVVSTEAKPFSVVPEPGSDGAWAGFTMTHGTGTIRVAFAEPVKCVTGKNGLKSSRGYQINRVAAELPTGWDKGQSRAFHYDIIPSGK